MVLALSPSRVGLYFRRALLWVAATVPSTQPVNRAKQYASFPPSHQQTAVTVVVRYMAGAMRKPRGTSSQGLLESAVLSGHAKWNPTEARASQGFKAATPLDPRPVISARAPLTSSAPETAAGNIGKPRDGQMGCSWPCEVVSGKVNNKRDQYGRSTGIVCCKTSRGLSHSPRPTCDGCTALLIGSTRVTAEHLIACIRDEQQRLTAAIALAINDSISASLSIAIAIAAPPTHSSCRLLTARATSARPSTPAPT